VNRLIDWFCLFGAALLSLGCAATPPPQVALIRSDNAEPEAVRRLDRLSAETRDEILALDPEHVTEEQVRTLLSQAPAPRILTIHGGPLPIKTRMNSFGRFLIAMGYPEASIRNPHTGSLTYGYYASSDKIAGTIAWYYEHDGLRPMVIGHSMGGIQTVRVLYKLAGEANHKIPVWNPVTGTAENRFEITDPLTGRPHSVVGLHVSYASAALSGGLARLAPNEWDMNGRLRKIPDSAEEFTGFHKGMDLLGGDYLGYGSANDYRPRGNAEVRNVRLPAGSAHGWIPDAKPLLNSPEITDWINNYQPGESTTNDLKFGSKNGRALWAAEVWHGIKKHWVLELQQLLRAKPASDHGN
jgi:hypothetical protein